MSFVDVNAELWREVAGICADEGLGLYDIERIGRGELRICVDVGSDTKVGQQVEQEACGADELGDDAETGAETALETVRGVTSGECSALCRRLMVYFSVEGERLGVGGEPYMEVCSPGINRNLRLSEHFVSAIGSRVKVVFHTPQLESESGKEFSHVVGTLVDVNTGAGLGAGDTGDNSREVLTVEDEHSGRIFTFMLAEVKRATLDFKFNLGKK